MTKPFSHYRSRNMKTIEQIPQVVQGCEKAVRDGGGKQEAEHDGNRLMQQTDSPENGRHKQQLMTLPSACTALTTENTTTAVFIPALGVIQGITILTLSRLEPA